MEESPRAAARDANGEPVEPGCWLECANRPYRRPHMVTAVDGALVWFADREPLHVGFLPWWRVTEPPPWAHKAKKGRGEAAGKRDEAR